MYNVVFLATYSLLCFLCLCFRFVFYKQHMAGVHNFCPFYWYILASEYLNLLYLSCLTYMVHACMLSCFNHYWLFVTLWIVALQAPLWDFPSKNTRVGCHAFFQGIFPIQGSNQCLLRLMHWQAGSLPLVPPKNKDRPRAKKCSINLSGSIKRESLLWLFRWAF